MKKKKVLVIVAHPDDETIWMGGTLFSNRNKWKTTIISLCRKNDKERVRKFKKACKLLNVACFISDLDDSETGSFKEISIKDIISRIKQFTEYKYDYIFTHGENGEYGHIRHIQIHNAVKEMLKNKTLCCKAVFFFSYVKKGKFCYADENADKFIKLNRFNFARKKYLIQDVYGFKKNSFEERCCRNIEAFKIKKLK